MTDPKPLVDELAEALRKEYLIRRDGGWADPKGSGRDATSGAALARYDRERGEREREAGGDDA